MPELPEVETTRRGVRPHVLNKTIRRVEVRDARLRWPVPEALPVAAQGQVVRRVSRRAKYLLFHLDAGVILMHLGMSGSLRVLPAATPPGPHDHVDLVLRRGTLLRFRDPRRFGCVLWLSRAETESHPLLAALGPEPLSRAFDGDYLFRRSRRRKVAIKNFIMNSRVVVGVGNIYASEALFRAGIRPGIAAGRVSRQRCHELAEAIKTVLRQAIRAGGTTLRDFTREDGNPGYFRHRLQVYARGGEPCLNCGTPVVSRVIGQRMSYYCPRCQS